MPSTSYDRPKRQSAVKAEKRIKRCADYLRATRHELSNPCAIVVPNDKQYNSTVKKEKKSLKSNNGHYPAGSGHHYDRNFNGNA